MTDTKFDRMVLILREFGYSDEQIINDFIDIFNLCILAANPVHEKALTESEKSEETVTRELLEEFGIPKHIKGYKYLFDAIIIYRERSKDSGIMITKELYPEIAKIHNTIPSRVERAIRHAVELAFDRCGPDVIEKFFKNTVSPNKDKPTNGEVIALFAEKVDIYLRTGEKLVTTENPFNQLVQNMRSIGYSNHKIIRELGIRFEKVINNFSEQNDFDQESNDFAERLKVIDIIEEFGIPKHVSGYNYLIDAVLLYKKEPNQKLIDGIYVDIGKKYGTTGSRVERAIRHAIELGTARCETSRFKLLFGNIDYVPTSKVVVATFAEKIDLT